MSIDLLDSKSQVRGFRVQPRVQDKQFSIVQYKNWEQGYKNVVIVRNSVQLKNTAAKKVYRKDSL